LGVRLSLSCEIPLFLSINCEQFCKLVVLTKENNQGCQSFVSIVLNRTMDLRALIEENRPSRVVSAARASLAEPSRPLTPIGGTRLTASDLTWKEGQEATPPRSLGRFTISNNDSEVEEEKNQIPLNISQLESDIEAHELLEDFQGREDELEKLWTLCEEACKGSGNSNACSKMLRKFHEFIVDGTAHSTQKIQAARICVRAGIMIQDGIRLREVFQEMCEISSSSQTHDCFRESGFLKSIMRHHFEKSRMTIEIQHFFGLVLRILRNVSQDNAANRNVLLQLGVVEKMTSLLDLFLEYKEDVPDNSWRVIIEVMALIRNLLDDKGSIKIIEENSVVKKVCACLGRFSKMSRGLTFNCVRVLSKLSTLPNGRDRIDVSCLIVELENSYMSELDIAVRICFVFGNITTSSENARQEIAGKGLNLLCMCLMHHACMYVAQRSDFISRNARETKEREDLLIKIVRVVANLSIEKEFGMKIASHPQVSENLKGILDSFSKKPGKSTREEELLLNVISCVSNLSFYENNSLQNETVVKLLLPDLFHENVEVIEVVLRTLANFSRSEEMQQMLVVWRIPEALILLLGHADRNLVLFSCGLLTNLTSQRTMREDFVRLNADKMLIDRLRRNVVSDLQLTSQICMLFCNFKQYGPLPSKDSLLQSLSEIVNISEEVAEEKSEIYSGFIKVAKELLN